MRMALGVASVVLARAASPCLRFLAKCASGLRPVSRSIPMKKMIRIAQHQLIFMNFNLPGQTQNCVLSFFGNELVFFTNHTKSI